MLSIRRQLTQSKYLSLQKPKIKKEVNGKSKEDLNSHEPNAPNENQYYSEINFNNQQTYKNIYTSLTTERLNDENSDNNSYLNLHSNEQTNNPTIDEAIYEEPVVPNANTNNGYEIYEAQKVLRRSGSQSVAKFVEKKYTRLTLRQFFQVFVSLNSQGLIV